MLGFSRHLKRLKQKLVPQITLSSRQYFGEREILDSMMTDRRMAEMDINEIQQMLPLRRTVATTKTVCVLYKVEAQKIWEIFTNIGDDFFQYELIKQEYRFKQIETFQQMMQEKKQKQAESQLSAAGAPQDRGNQLA